VLTPSLDFHGCVGVGHLERPQGVCANADIVVVSEAAASRISVFSRRDGALIRRIGARCGAGFELGYLLGLCFTRGDRGVAVADEINHRVCELTVGGELVRHVGVGVLDAPQGVACSAFDELVVADVGNERVAVFCTDGSVGRVLDCGNFSGAAVLGGTIVALDSHSEECVLFE
jgi:hypothetical protein